MTVLVGLSPSARDDVGGGVALAVRLATAWDEDLAVVVVVGAGSSAGEDEDAARAAVEPLLAQSSRAARWRVVRGRGAADGLVTAAREEHASAIVLGTDPHRSGVVAARVARETAVPVGLGRPDTDPTTPITRVTCAYSGARGADAVLAAAADLAWRAGAALRVASFAVQRPPSVPPEVGLDAEAPVVAGWAEQLAAAQTDALSRLRRRSGADDRLGQGAETGVWSGASWPAAVGAAGWDRGDLLVAGSSPGPVSRLLLGDTGRAIVEAAPAPSLVV